MDIFALNEFENIRAKSFRVRFIPKRDKSVHIIQSEALVTREFLRQYDGETRVAMEALDV
ncbi:hypothetical protein BGZ61DRAFT_461293 [Ilyonectria robusta]|uniref:uncharacterized protein n=1 Tax=Ilyonectria robusta TaxID=1079257 RepID=UPI001E8EE1F8|nr:uncharacterized protein BGZ61DRAFT_461293 [Ilyonectria robusta]KAH8667142.1 hypothetical protein BGZ61DRAFT_461293 [Ilyonectria robusta]